MHAEQLPRQFFHHLEREHVQLDKLRTWLWGKLPKIWLWTALDVRTKVIAVLEVGPRTQAMAHRLIHKLVGVPARGCVPVFSSDGLKRRCCST
jgi:transposase-like protein